MMIPVQHDSLSQGLCGDQGHDADHDDDFDEKSFLCRARKTYVAKNLPGKFPIRVVLK